MNQQNNNIINIVSIITIALGFFLMGLSLAPEKSQATICPLDLFEGHAETIIDAIKNQDYAEAQEQAELILELTGKAAEEKD